METSYHCLECVLYLPTLPRGKRNLVYFMCFLWVSSKRRVEAFLKIWWEWNFGLLMSLFSFLVNRASDAHAPIDSAHRGHMLADPQLVEQDGKVYLFKEIQREVHFPHIKPLASLQSNTWWAIPSRCYMDSKPPSSYTCERWRGRKSPGWTENIKKLAHILKDWHL